MGRGRKDGLRPFLTGWRLQGGRAQNLATQMCSSEERLLPTRVPLDGESAGGASSSAPQGRSAAGSSPVRTTAVVDVVEDITSDSAVDGSATQINEDGIQIEDAIQIENLEADVPLV